MESFKRLLKKIFVLPPLPTVLIAVLGYAFVILVSALQIDIPVLRYLSYTCSAYALIITITGFPHFLAFINAVKRYIREHPLMRKLQGTAIGSRYFSDVRFRTEISLYQGLVINLLYIALKLFSGVRYRSYWFIALAIYYILLAFMRFLLLRRGKKKMDRTPMDEEIRRYRLCGIMLLVMNQALMGIVVYMVQQNKGFDYPGYLIYVMALYAFYAVITAAVNIVKFRKHGSPVLSAAKAINLVAAMVSILSLETAMLAQFGGDDTPDFRQLMTASVGGGVCTIVIGMAAFMIWRSGKLMKMERINNSQT